MNHSRETTKKVGRWKLAGSYEFFYAFYKIPIDRRQCLPRIWYKTRTNIFSICCSQIKRPMVFELQHDSPLSGDLARDKTLKKHNIDFIVQEVKAKRSTFVRFMPKIKAVFKQHATVKIDKSY